MEELKKKIEKLLLKVQRPSRYIGGEVGSVVKDKDKVDVRFAFCFPDTYEVGMSHLGMKILYGLKNARENWWCERVFMPEEDYNKLMRENDIPLYALESLDPIKDFDFIGFTLMYELSYNNVLEMLDLAGVPVLARIELSLHHLLSQAVRVPATLSLWLTFSTCSFLARVRKSTLSFLNFMRE